MSAAYAASPIQRTGSTAPHRTSQAKQLRPTVTDDYERWYTEGTPNNRMLLALRSGIDSEVSWALDRLTRLCNNEQFVLQAIPGLTDALFEWPVWYVEVGAALCSRATTLFALPQEWEQRRKHALESILILRNAAVNEPNAHELSEHRRTRSLILLALHNIKPDSDANVEFVLYVIELLHSISAGLSLPPPDAPALAIPVQPLHEIAGTSSNRTLILVAMTTLNLLLSNPANVAHLTEESPTLEASIRYLPLLTDKALLDASVNYLYTHLSHPAMTKAFLLHPKMPGVLRLLVSLLLSEQVEETVSVDIAGPIHTAPSSFTTVKDHELSKEELERLVSLPEPQRCFEWMRTMFIAKADGELTQVEFWNLYKDAFTPYVAQHPMLAASDVIKNVNMVYPPAQAMVLVNPHRFVVRGVDRRKERSAIEQQFKCLWDSSQCSSRTFGSTAELFEHVVNAHIDPHSGSEVACSWASCSHASLPKALLRGHVLTHLPNSQSAPKDPGQTDVTLPYENYPHPIPNPTSRPLPPPRTAKLTYKRPVSDPPSTSLTALLCIRVLFRASFASSDAAPRADEDHFGFPGIVEETEDAEVMIARSAGNDREREGERRGRKAFIGIRHLLENVTIKDEALMGWITEMVDAGITGTT
ncbi:uncharacterized protein C8Q71DRAFT_808771 [Rhodofomes roseus]|uniref:RFX-type winged-helix domain-containing protein n=1 Tax=Rhodofomes roseus TaxID=34475 RepID=A0A4Y9Z849_9APHY|nr:uncharacterized protein C8Q71DRAFT_808771 [Rhodofomes roseus]KAH9836941.1 hypothetical protein C8Q71DRAFT_808771 [Rhodofomes roseus]TFY70008.1 hypothetical protein EVJ58_g113 [Rhodofomes roseus]